MQIISQSTYHILIRFDKNEEVITGLNKYVKEMNIFGTFTALGAACEVVLSYYDLPTKTYLDKIISDDLEITGVTGNIARMENMSIIHAHGTFADKKYHVIGGHIKRLRVSATCEVALTILPLPIARAYDKDTGLNLLTTPSTD